MSVITVKDRLATILGSVTGITSAIQGVPRNITPADLPAVVILTGRAPYTTLASDLDSERRTYRLVLLLKPWQQGIDLEAESLAEPFFARVRQAFADRPSLQSVDNTDPLVSVQRVRLLEDSGVIDVLLADVAYAGIEWQLEVEEYLDVDRGL